MANKSRLDFFLVVAFLAVMAFIAGYLLFTGSKKPSKGAGKAPHAAIPHAAAPGKQGRPGPAPRHYARVAIIIDDLGNDMEALRKVMEIGAPLDVAVLPRLRHSKETAVKAKEAGLEVLLHLPMQPKGGSLKGLGPGALLDGMDGKAVEDTVSRGLESVPGAVGVNNHMGSAYTEDVEAMGSVMSALKRRGLFYIDSRTTAGSVALKAARGKGVKASARKVFLDDTDDPAEVRRQLDRLVRLARRDKEAIAIGHPHPVTLSVLRQETPALRERGIELVKASALVK